MTGSLTYCDLFCVKWVQCNLKVGIILCKVRDFNRHNEPNAHFCTPAFTVLDKEIELL